MMHTRIKPLTGELLDRVDAIAYTADQVSTLLDLAATELKTLEDAAAREGLILAKLSHWNAIRTLLSVSDQQLDLIRGVSVAVAAASRPSGLD